MDADTEAVVTFLRQWADTMERRGVETLHTCNWSRLNPTTGHVDGVRQVKAGNFHVLHVIVELKPLTVPNGD